MNEIQKAIDRLKRMLFNNDSQQACKSLNMAISALEQQLTNGWIPIKDRRPDASGKYRVTVKYENFAGVYLMVADATFEKDVWKILGEQPVISIKKVIAWQPIVQEPYEEGSN